MNSSTWDYISENFIKNFEETKNPNNSTFIHQNIIDGGEEYYYEFFKAIDEGNQPQSLYFTYSCTEDIYKNVSVYIWICEEIYKAQCINNENTKCAYNEKIKIVYLKLYVIKLKMLLNLHVKM